NLWLHEYQTHVLLQKLKRAELDLLILALPVESDEFSELHLFNEPFQLAVPENDPLAKHSSITINDINQRELILLEEGHCLRGQTLDVCFKAGARENKGFHASSLETLRHMVREGMGITLIPELATQKSNQVRQNIRYLPFENNRPSRQVGMLFRKNSYRKQTYINLNRTIIQALQPLLNNNQLIT
ncbi:MAG: LysR substrate-binding domain-containing protein, partial [Gammaproteobacteria bacterium]|nr:LysR substrate-binding domain-containing protein [Gammaproteobacteria bacterium]